MATLFGLTNYTEIVIQLGIDKSELKEAEFDSSGVKDELQLDLLRWFPSYQALSDIDSSEPSVLSQKLALKVYCKVFCAEQISITSPMRFVQQSGDGDNATKRFQSSTSLNTFKTDLSNKKAEMKNIVLSYTTAYSPVVPTGKVNAPTMARATPSSDKITG